MREDFTTPEHKHSYHLFAWSQRDICSPIRRIWRVSPSMVSPQTWRWLTTTGL